MLNINFLSLNINFTFTIFLPVEQFPEAESDLSDRYYSAAAGFDSDHLPVAENYQQEVHSEEASAAAADLHFSE